MQANRWKQIEDLFQAAVEHAPQDRPAFLAQACGADEDLRREVEKLLAADAATENATLELPAQMAAEWAQQQDGIHHTQLLHYRILSQLGAGGMGEVYLAEDTRLKRKVAIKLLPNRFTNDADRVRRFEQEALAISALNHPNIITIHEIGETAAGRFIVMEHVAGRTLRSLVAEQIELTAILAWGAQIAKALHAAHAAKIIHRDIKPDNIMVRDDGYVKVLDFGLARLNTAHDELSEAMTMPGTVMGTVKYMSPEQTRGESVMAASDIFALGIVLYELATGQHPFNGATLFAVMQAITTQAPVVPVQLNPALPPELNALLLRMLAKEAAQRPSAADVEKALQEIERGREREKGSESATLLLSSLPTPSVPSTPIRHTVGRTHERNELRAAFNGANTGRGSLLCVAGEPGIGKTTLVEDFLVELAAAGQCTMARGRCSERLAGTEAYLPLLEALESLLQGNRNPAIAQVMKQLAPTWYAQVVSLSGDNEESVRLLAEVKAASQERMKRELANFLQAVAQTQPLVIFFDDLHWADVSTTDLLSFLAGKFNAMRVLIVVTYRPSDMLLSKHPFLQIRPDLQAHGVCRELLLEFLNAAEIAEYLALEFPGHHFPPEFPQLIHAKTEGSPLFMADLVRYLRDHSVIANTSGAWRLEQTLPDIERELPESVRGMIERKIAQLSEDDRKLLVAASVQGTEFDSAVVAQVLSLGADEVEERLEKLERVFAFVKLTSEAEFPNRTLTLKYRFIHALYQNALYATLRMTRRAALSREVAQALESFYGAQVTNVTDELAVLWESARESAKAAHYFLLGAQQASEIFATHEAGQLAQRGLALLHQMPETEERQRRELPLQVILGNFFLATRGLAAPETAKAYDRIRELSQQTGDTQHLLPMLYGQAIRYIFKAAFDQALEVCQEFRTIAERQHDPTLLIADRLIGTVNLFKGELKAASQNLEKCLAAYNPALHHSLAWRYGSEPGVLAYCLRALTRWLRGYPEQALADSQEALRLAAAIPHTHTQTFALMYTAMLHQCLRAPQQVLELTAQQIRLSEEQGLAMLQALGTTIHAWATAEQGESAAGIAGIRQGMERLRATGAELFRAPYYCVLAELYGKAGQVNAGFDALAEAQAAVELHQERWWEAELYRLRGELLLQSGTTSMEVGTEAEASLQQALAIARQQEAKSLELRAAMSLARLWQQQGRITEARQVLAGIYGWFTEGFDTPDLQDAKTLLDNLRISAVSPTLSNSPSPVRKTVGRNKERAELQAAFDVGRGLLLCVAGEPGMGKTTLVEEFLSELASNQTCLIARGRCSERLAGTEAYLPLLEALDSLLRVDQDGSCARMMRQVAPTWYAQVAPLGENNSSAGRLLEEVRNASQERMKRELAAFLQMLSQASPLLIFFDDLHWADVSTIDLLAYLAGKFDTTRVLIVVTYRPSDLLLAKHPFLQIRPDLQARGLCRELTLEFLSLAEIETYFALEFPQHRFPAALPQLIQAKTEGNPLFMTDLVRYLRDRGVLAEQAGHWTLVQTLPDIERELPESVRGMIERKIAQLNEDDRKLLVAASVQGYEFDSAVVAQALNLDAGEVEEQLEKLERVFAFVRLIREAEFPNRELTLKYRFVHVLYQNELYATLRATRRATMSGAVAQALLRFYGEQSVQIASELAHLFEAARDFLRAAEYFRLAALNAVKVLATQEALTLAHRGLMQLQSLPDTSEKQEQELALQVVLGNLLSATKGFAAPEVEQTYARARVLCQQLGDTPHLLPVLFGLSVNHWVSGRHRQALTLGQEFLTLAQQTQDAAVVVALRMVGGPLLCLGELTEARPFFEQLISLHDSKQHRALTYLYGQEPGVAGRLFFAWLLWLRGSPDQALKHSQEAIQIAREVVHAPSQAYALTYAAFVHQYRREPAQVRKLAAAVIELTTEHGLAQFSGWGHVLHGWALTEEGQAQEGIAQMRRGLAASLVTGTEVLRPNCLLLLAEAYGQAGQLENALATLDEMQSFIEKNEEREWEAELHRWRGELLRTQQAGEAEQCFHHALSIAQRQQARSLELRATISLARLWQQQGRVVEARQRLVTIYNAFTEGFNTPDLQEAKALLDNLTYPA